MRTLVSPSHSTKTVSQAEQLKKLQAQASALRQQLLHAQGMESLGMLALMVAHEFNNILTPIIAYAQQAMTKPQFVEQALAHAVNGGGRAKVICERLLGMTPGDGAKTDENMRELVQDTLTAMARDPHKDGIELTLDIPADLRVRTGRVELQQVLVNLLMNARHALLGRPGPRRILIAARREKQAVTLSVSDSGPGIPPTILDDIFKPFFTTKSPAAADDHSGHGLGLPFCRDILTALGGEIRADSPAGQGATFVIKLFE